MLIKNAWGGATADGLPTYRGRIHEYFRGLKTGPLVDQSLVDHALIDTGHAINRPTLESYADLLVSHIREAGDESLAHLCLPTLYRNALRRKNITTIDGVRDILESGEIDHVRILRGRSGRREVVTALADFDRLSEQVNK